MNTSNKKNSEPTRDACVAHLRRTGVLIGAVLGLCLACSMAFATEPATAAPEWSMLTSQQQEVLDYLFRFIIGLCEKD